MAIRKIQMKSSAFMTMIMVHRQTLISTKYSITAFTLASHHDKNGDMVRNICQKEYSDTELLRKQEDQVSVLLVFYFVSIF